MMLFSGSVSSYQCPACASVYAKVIPTSLLPIAVVIGLTAAPWTRVLGLLVPFKWVAVLLGVVTSVTALWLIHTLLEALTNRKLRRGVCRKCGAKLRCTGAGFYDGGRPSLRELVTYMLALALAFGVAAVLRG